MEKRREHRRKDATSFVAVERRERTDRRRSRPAGAPLELLWMAENAAALSLLFQRLETCLRAAAVADRMVNLEAADSVRAEIESRVADLQAALFTRRAGPVQHSVRKES